jgi:deoxyadenosine/deoxycytidine kinase
MNSAVATRQEETEWAERIRQHASITRRAAILSVCGPSGVGKSTISRGLARSYPTYIESTDGNPHLYRLLEGRPDFNAAENQKWFLNRIADYVFAADPLRPLVLDQDPAAVVLVYARLFCDAGLMDEAEYGDLFTTLFAIEERLLQWTVPRSVMWLDAPAETLSERVVQRSPASKTPPIAWFADVRRSFAKMCPHFPRCTRVLSSEFPPDALILRARSLLAGECPLST